MPGAVKGLEDTFGQPGRHEVVTSITRPRSDGSLTVSAPSRSSWSVANWLVTNANNYLVLPTGRAGTDFAAAGVGARFHRGFLDALEMIWEPLLAAVDQAQKVKERPLWITGHSLGGALALLAADAPRNRLYVDPLLPSWLPDLTVQDLRIGKHRMDIRFWREGEQTEFEVIRGDRKLVERCDMASKIAQLRIASDPI